MCHYECVVDGPIFHGAWWNKKAILNLLSYCVYTLENTTQLKILWHVMIFYYDIIVAKVDHSSTYGNKPCICDKLICLVKFNYNYAIVSNFVIQGWLMMTNVISSSTHSLVLLIDSTIQHDFTSPIRRKNLIVFVQHAPLVLHM